MIIDHIDTVGLCRCCLFVELSVGLCPLSYPLSSPEESFVFPTNWSHSLILSVKRRILLNRKLSWAPSEAGKIQSLQSYTSYYQLYKSYSSFFIFVLFWRLIISQTKSFESVDVASRLDFSAQGYLYSMLYPAVLPLISLIKFIKLNF